MKSEEWAAMKAQNKRDAENHLAGQRPTSFRGRKQKEATWERKMARRVARRAAKRATTINK